MRAWNENRLTSKLGIDYPIIQGPLGGLSSQRLTVTVSNFGGLGSFGAHGLPPEAIKDVIAEIRFRGNCVLSPGSQCLVATISPSRRPRRDRRYEYVA